MIIYCLLSFVVGLALGIIVTLFNVYKGDYGHDS